MSTTGTTPAAAAPVDTWQPLGDAQLGLWFAQRLDPGNPVFNTGQYVDIRGALDIDAFTAAVAQAMREADALAVTVEERDGRVVQAVDDTRRSALEVIDLRRTVDAEGHARAAMDADLATPLDPSTDRLVLQRLYRLAGDRCLWYLRVHHLLIDGFGTNLLVWRIADLYASAVTGQPAATKPLAGLEALAEHDRAYAGSAAEQTNRQFWIDHLRDAPAVAGLGTGVAITARSYRRRAFDLSPAVGAALTRLSKDSGVPWPDIIAAVIAAYIVRHTGGTETTIGLAAMGRMGTPAARVPGMVMNILPVRVPIDEAVPLGEWLRQVGSLCRDARRHGRYRSERLRRDLGLVGGDRRLHGPIVNVLPFEEPPVLPGVETSLHILATGPVDDLTITLRGDAGLARVAAEMDANPNLYTEAALDAHVTRFGVFLERALTSETLSAVPTVTGDEARQILGPFNDSAHDVPVATLDTLMKRRASDTPDAVALVDSARSLDYATLERTVDRVATHLAAAGVRRGDIVAVAIPRSIEQVVTLRAIIRCGAAYLPLDLDSPAERLARILASARPRAVVTSRDASALVPGSVPMVSIDTAMSTDAGDRRVVIDAPRPRDAAYVIYTSGSTGEPKGVVIEHEAIVNRLEWMRERYAVGPGDRILQKTPATFDVSVWEFFLAFTSGATLVVAPPGVHRDPRALAALMVEQRISIVHFVPSMLAEWLAEPSASTGSLRAVICSGEALPAPLRDQFHARVTSELHNLYGPTEAAVDVSEWAAGPDDHSDPVPIGTPVWNTRLYVLDDRDRLLPIGVVGHLCLAGVQLAREYLGRPDLTADRFVPDPYGEPGARMYRTGDVARWRDDGAVEFLGRSDHQVKIRGQRIELGEIEAALADMPGIARSVVMARDIGGGDKMLAAYVETADAAAFDGEAVRRHVAIRLPDAMVPAAVVQVTEWPTTTNGKLDRQRLPAPSRGGARVRRAETPSESRLVALAAEVLDLDPALVHADDDFFALGGHSLRAARLVRRLRDEWSVDVGLGAVFQHQTIASLAAHVDALGGASTAHSEMPVVIVLRDGPTDRPALTCVHPAGGMSWCYGTLARSLGEPRPVYGMQARGLRHDQPLPASLDALARDYVDELRARQPQGPYHLLGWSIGGIIAQAMAVAIEAQGAEVGVLAMLDAYPSDRWRGLADPDEHAALRAVLLMAGERPEEAPSPLTRDAVIARLRAGHHPLGAMSDAEVAGVLRVVEHNNRLVRRHEHQPCRAPLLHVRADLEHADDGVNAGEWRPYVGTIDARHVDARHAHMTGPVVSPIVAAWLEERFA